MKDFSFMDREDFLLRELLVSSEKRIREMFLDFVLADMASYKPKNAFETIYYTFLSCQKIERVIFDFVRDYEPLPEVSNKRA